MKKYITKISFFFLFLLIWFSINYSINNYFIKNTPVGEPCTTLLIGNSHIKSGINPDLIPNSSNIAQPAESFILSFHKLKKVHSFYKDSINDIILGISHGSISGYNDQKFKEKNFAQEFIYRAYPILSFEEMNQTGVDWRLYIKTIIKYKLIIPKRKHDSYIGFFNPRKNVKNKRSPEAYVKRHFYYPDGKEFDVSTTSIQYLDSIVNYCKKENLNLYTLYIPHREEYISLIPEKFDIAFDAVTEDLEKENIPFIDLHQVDIGMEYFSDYDHLNGKGADKVTNILKKRINK